MLLKRFAPLLRVKAMPPFSPLPPMPPSPATVPPPVPVLPVPPLAPTVPASPKIVLLTLPFPAWRVPLTTEMMELLLVLVMFPEKRTTKEPVGSKTSEAALVTFP
jgi:hypothetical protein